jgi:hypothetical protein
MLRSNNAQYCRKVRLFYLRKLELTTNGPKLNLPLDGGEAISWLHMLGGGGDVIVAALPQESHVTLFTPEPVELDLLFIETGICQMTSDSAKKTADFVNFCYTLPL